MKPRPTESLREAPLRYFESGNNDWFLELNGQRLAVLYDPQWTEMFWNSYRVDLLVDVPDAVFRAYARRDWDEGNFQLRHVESGLLVAEPLVAGFHVSEIRGDMIYAPGGRIVLRCVYPIPSHPTLIESLFLACRILKRSVRNLTQFFKESSA